MARCSSVREKSNRLSLGSPSPVVRLEVWERGAGCGPCDANARRVAAAMVPPRGQGYVQNLKWLRRRSNFLPGRWRLCSRLDDMIDEEIRRDAKGLEAAVKLSEF